MVLLVHLELLEKVFADVGILFERAVLPFFKLSLKVILSNVFLYSKVPPIVALSPFVWSLSSSLEGKMPIVFNTLSANSFAERRVIK